MLLWAYKKLPFFLPLMSSYYFIKIFLILKGLLSLRIPLYKKTVRGYDLREVKQLNEQIEIIVNLLITHSSHVCFYRSYAAISIFRSLGVPVQINIGLRGLEGQQKCVGGHAWVTLEKQSLRDEKEVTRLYPFELGMNNQGINYWAGRKASNHILRIKQIN